MARREFHRKIYRKHPRLVLASGVFLGCFLFFVFCFLFLFIYYAKDLPRPEVFTERPLSLPTNIYDRTGKVQLYQIYEEENRTIVPLSEIPVYFKEAVISAEDADFYHHFGLDIKGILRAVLKNLKIGKPTYGGSTISQQLIRSTFLTPEKTLQRKIKEVILTLGLERRYSKDQILEFYFNQVPFGSNAYGAGAATQVYFNKPVSQISLGEAALLAALIRAPSYLSPYGEQKDELLARKNYVLDRMVELDYLKKEEAEIAKNESLSFADPRHPIKAPHFVLYVKNYLEENYPDYLLKTGGLKVYTTLDWELQELAEKAVKDGVQKNRKVNCYNAALVAINPKTGETLAMVGSADWYTTSSYPMDCTPGLNCLFEPKVNVAVYGKGRQPGSAFKPLAYSVAFQKGLIPDTVVWDVKTEFNPDCDPSGTEEKDQFGLECYHPQNYKDITRGPVTLRQALAQSINIPSVQVLYLAGIKDTIDLAKKMGITTLNNPPSWYGLPLVLGGGEVKLLDMVSAYSVFATEGLRVPPVFISKIEDSQGNIIEENKKTPQRVLESQTARLINNILSDNEARAPMFGLNSPLYFQDYQVAVKTGTTQDYKDAWTIGYSPTIAVGVWAGNNDSTPVGDRPGVMLAAPIWREFIEKALLDFPKENFNPPVPTIITTPTLEESATSTHSILYYIRENPELDPQYQNWEWAIQNYLTAK